MKIKNSKTSYMIPYDVAFKEGSFSTPARPVLNAIAKTPGGESLKTSLKMSLKTSLKTSLTTSLETSHKKSLKTSLETRTNCKSVTARIFDITQSLHALCKVWSCDLLFGKGLLAHKNWTICWIIMRIGLSTGLSVFTYIKSEPLQLM